MAISPAVAQAITGQRAPDIMGSFDRGQETAFKNQERARQEKIRELSGMAAQGVEGKMHELAGLAPDVAFKIKQSMGVEHDDEADRFLEDARTLEQYLIKGDKPAALSLIRSRMNGLERMGAKDTSHTQYIYDLVMRDDMGGALSAVSAITSGVDQLKAQGDTPRQREFAQFAAMPEDTEAQITEKRQFGQAIGAIAKTKERLTPEQFREEERAKAGGKAEGKGAEERQQIAIDRGIEAADSTANLRRTMTLLNEIKTGGLAAANQKAKRLFGIEGASEGELSNALGTAVLSQLKATFGAAFTAQEGERLEKLSAGFGKSPAANRRIIKQSLQIAERSARRGIRAAELRGDDETASQIREAMEFTLDPAQEATPTQQGQGQPTVSSQAQFDALPSGALFTEDGQTFRKP